MSRKWTDEDTRQRKASLDRKWAQAQRTKVSRPYIMLLAVGDKRDPPECLALNHIVVHIDNPWLLPHLPPHYRECRCTFRTLNDRQMIREGVAITPEAQLPKHFQQSKRSLLQTAKAKP